MSSALSWVVMVIAELFLWVKQIYDWWLAWRGIEQISSERWLAFVATLVFVTAIAMLNLRASWWFPTELITILKTLLPAWCSVFHVSLDLFTFWSTLRLSFFIFYVHLKLVYLTGHNWRSATVRRLITLYSLTRTFFAANTAIAPPINRTTNWCNFCWADCRVEWRRRILTFVIVQLHSLFLID